MSWRVLISILILAGAVSWWGGIELGEWLVQKAPDAISSTTGNKSNAVIPTLDANGRAYVAEPPQPRIDGTLGVPKEIATMEWSILAFDVDGVVRDSEDMIRIDVPKAEADMEARELATGGRELPTGPSDIRTLDVASSKASGVAPPYPNTQVGGVPYALSVVPNQAPPNPPITPTAIPTPPAPKPPGNTPRADVTKTATETRQGWQQSLHTDIGRCSQFNFFDRPRCIEQVQRKYCGPNNAWGKIPDCPDLMRSSTQPGG